MLPERILEIAYHQDDLITRAQALAAGMSPVALRHAYGPGGRWQPVLRGVYATFTGDLADVHRFRAALLHSVMAPLPRAVIDAERFRQLAITVRYGRQLPAPERRDLPRSTRAAPCEVVQRQRRLPRRAPMN